MRAHALAWALLASARATSSARQPTRAAADADRPRPPAMDFVPPAAGSYVLQRIQQAPDGLLLDPDGQTRRLVSYTTGKITLLTFFYTYCVDPWGCPFAYQTLTGLRARVLAEPGLAERVRFVNISFDPSHDTPEAIGRYAALLQTEPRLEWRFLTARNVDELLPVLDAFGQDVAVVYDADGKPTRTINHMLKMFLIDPSGSVREIYSLAYLQQPMMLNDIKTLALEGRAWRSGYY
jgi:YD repeat-containing protein